MLCETTLHISIYLFFVLIAAATKMKIEKNKRVDSNKLGSSSVSIGQGNLQFKCIDFPIIIRKHTMMESSWLYGTNDGDITCLCWKYSLFSQKSKNQHKTFSFSQVIQSANVCVFGAH